MFISGQRINFSEGKRVCKYNIEDEGEIYQKSLEGADRRGK